MTTKSDATKGQSSKWGKGAGKASGLTWGDLRSGCGSSNPGREARLRRQGSAEAIVPSPSRWEGPNIEKGQVLWGVRGTSKEGRKPRIGELLDRGGK